MNAQQIEQALDVIRRCRQSAQRAATDGDRIRWNAAADRLERALESRGAPRGYTSGAFDEALERIIEQAHATLP